MHVGCHWGISVTHFIQEEFDRTRELYERLLKRTEHVKVWISYAEFEVSTQNEVAVLQSRGIFKRADKALNGEEKVRGPGSHPTPFLWGVGRLQAKYWIYF